MALGIAAQVVGLNVGDRSFVNVSRGDMSAVNEVAEPGGGLWVEFIVVGGHARYGAGLTSAPLPQNPVATTALPFN